MTLAHIHAAPLPGFDDPVHDAQNVFRQILEAMSHPGLIVSADGPPETPSAMGSAMVALALALFDRDTPVWLDATLAEEACVADYLRFHCGCPIVQRPDAAAFALVGAIGSLPRLERFSPGTAAYPEGGATVIVEVPRLTGGPAVVLTGPGIRTTRDFDPVGLPDWFWDGWTVNRAGFPLGVDMIFTSGEELCALPRSTKAEV